MDKCDMMIVAEQIVYSFLLAHSAIVLTVIILLTCLTDMMNKLFS